MILSFSEQTLSFKWFWFLEKSLVRWNFTCQIWLGFLELFGFEVVNGEQDNFNKFRVKGYRDQWFSRHSRSDKSHWFLGINCVSVVPMTFHFSNLRRWKITKKVERILSWWTTMLVVNTSRSGSDKNLSVFEKFTEWLRIKMCLPIGVSSDCFGWHFRDRLFDKQVIAVSFWLTYSFSLSINDCILILNQCHYSFEICNVSDKKKYN